YAVVAHVVLPRGKSWCEGHSLFLDRRKDRFVPWAGVGSCVSDDINATSNRGQHVLAAVWVNKDRFAQPMRFVYRGLNGAPRKRGTARQRVEQLDPVQPVIAGPPRGSRRFGS